MTCEPVRDAIHEAFDEDPMPPLPDGVRSHLASCAACREFLCEMTALQSALRALPHEPLPPAALDVVWSETVRARSRGLWRAAAAAFFVTMLGAGTLYVVSTSGGPPEPSPAELARASAQAELVLGYAARALAATRAAATRHVIEDRVSPAVRGEAAPRTSRRSS